LDRIISLDLQFNIDHNHPAPYGGDGDVPLDSPIFTCLSGDDMNIFVEDNIGFRIGYNTGWKHERGKTYAPDYFHFDNLIKSMSCDCSNGTRMTIVNNHKPSISKVNSEDEIHITHFWDAEANLLKNWIDYRWRMETDASSFIYTNKQSGKYDNLNNDELMDKLKEDTDNYIRNQTRIELPKSIKNNIKEFEDLGVELRVDWL
jgi:hypothetical protein